MGTINFLKESYNVNMTQNKLIDKLNIDQLNELTDTITNEVVSKHSDIIKQIKDRKVKQTILESKIIELIDRKNIIIEGLNREELMKKVMDEVFGYSFLQKYIEDPEVNDIMVNNYDTIFIRKNQTDIQIKERFRNKEHYNQFLYKVCAFIGEKINESSPQVDGTDSNYGLRINITVAPINTYSPSLIIRKRHKHFPMDFITEQGNMSKEMQDTLSLLAKVGCRIVFSGQVESGKTTLMNSYLNLIDKRTVIMEDTPELMTTNPNTIYQKTIKSDNEEASTVTLADLVKNFRRTNGLMPVVGEVRGPEAVYLLDLFNTGFMSGASSLHANSVPDTVRQLIFQIKASGKLGVDRKELEEYIGRTIDIIIYIEKRKIIEMTEIYYDYEKEELIFHPLHKFVIEKETTNEIEGYYKNNINPFSKKMQDRIRRAGLSSEISKEMFK